MPEVVLRHKTNSLRLLHSCPDLVRNALFHKVPGSINYSCQRVNLARKNLTVTIQLEEPPKSDYFKRIHH